MQKKLEFRKKHLDHFEQVRHCTWIFERLWGYMKSQVNACYVFLSTDAHMRT